MLRSAREERGISLPEAERETKIRQKYITALEDDNLAGLPGPVYARGFLRNYANYLGLDADDVVDMFDQQSQPTREKIRAARGQPPGKPASRPDTEKISIQPLSSERIDTRVRYGTQYIALSLLAIPLIIVFYFVYNAYAGPRSTNAPIPTTTVRPATVTPLPATTVIVGGPGNGAFNTPTIFIPATPGSDAIQSITATAAAAAITNTAPLTPTVAAAADITVKVTVTDHDAWMSVTVDGVQKFSGTLAKGGTTRTWNGKNTIQIRTGRADSVRVTVNGTDIGLMGTPTNQIVEKRWDKSGKETIVSP
jgi:cytoskeletal protein RodZ